jgi:hypothetical protein
MDQNENFVAVLNVDLDVIIHLYPSLDYIAKLLLHVLSI